MVYYPREVTMDHKNDCLICGKPLTYLGESRSAECVYCKKTYMTDALCEAGHYVCDACHSAGADDLIEGFCLTSEMTDPVEMACLLMKSPQVKMHGPEHHFLVPAVLLAAHAHATAAGELRGRLAEARRRAASVLGGFCGTHGSCGAATGVGIFVSLVTGATPLSGEPWRLANLATATARALARIAESGGPRCCKRDTLLALLAAADFAAAHLDLVLPCTREPRCGFHPANRQCRWLGCPFFPPDAA